MSLATRFVLSVTAVSAVGLGVWVAPGCQPAEQAGPPAIDASYTPPPEGGVAYCGDAGIKCCANPGQSPSPKCDDGDEALCKSSTTCTSNPGVDLLASSFDGGPNGCGSIAPGSCEPLANNPASGVQNFRMRRLIVVAPSKLASSTVQLGVINLGVDMNEPQCAELQTGNFSWLLSFDTNAHTLKTGGAPPCDLPDTPSCDPYTTGYCFVNKDVTSPAGSIHVQPITVATTTAADGTLQTAPIPSLNIPIYFAGSIITLPILGGSLQGVTISDNGNCIGSVNANALAADCSDDYTACSKWLTAGALTGYITLNQANSVQVVQPTHETLCSLLTGDTAGVPQKSPGGVTIQSCQVDANGNVTDQGNYCSKQADGGPPGPGGCNDSFWLAATFAASAVNINDGTGVADCTYTGASGEDSGTPEDSGPSDAGPG